MSERKANTWTITNHQRTAIEYNITIYAVVTSSASAFSASSSLGWGEILTIILTKFRILDLRRFLRRTVPENDVISTTCIAVLWREGVSTHHTPYALHYTTAAITTMQSYECGINQSMIIRHCLWHRRRRYLFKNRLIWRKIHSPTTQRSRRKDIGKIFRFF